MKYPSAIKLLFVDDDRVDQLAFTRLVETEGLPYVYDVADSAAEALRLLETRTYDVVVSDHHLGDGTAFDLLGPASGVPVIVATGMGDEELAVRALHEGAYDYITKDAQHSHLRLLPLKIEKSLDRHRAILEREEAQRQQHELLARLEKSHDDLLSILNLLRLGVAMIDENGRLTFLSHSCTQILGADPGGYRGCHWEEVCPFADSDKASLRGMIQAGPQDRSMVAVRVLAPSNQHFTMEIEVQDDPRDARRKIFLLYDMTAVDDLRRMLNKQAAFEGMVGKSAAIQRVFEQIRDLACVDTTVLIEGETGTGKELAARAIHLTGPRKDRPFVPLNCAGLTESLLASQLFGHCRGAFTGAVTDSAGVFETADTGTLFLDEIGDITPNVQTSLLRVLEEKHIIRLGETTARKVDVRIIAATHRDLSEEVQEGRFRSDLLYRIRIARIKLPPLQDRRTDIPLLAQVFLRGFRASMGKGIEDISSEATGLLLEYAWPGNVRELGSAIEFACIHCRGSVIQAEDLPPEILRVGQRELLPAGAAGDERSRFKAALQRAGGNRTAAARLLGISRATFYRRLQELSI